MSQLELSLRSGVGQRHVSFVETGRSRPGRDVVLRLAQALEIPLEEQNALLKAAGFGAAWSQKPLSPDELAPFRQVVAEMITRQEPFPAYVMDAYWQILSANNAARRLLADFAPEATEGMNAVDILLAPGLMREAVSNFDEVMLTVASEIERDLALCPDDPVLNDLYSRITREVGTEKASPFGRVPVQMVRMRLHGRQITTLSAVARFHGGRENVPDELRVELVYPADPESREFFLRSAASS